MAQLSKGYIYVHTFPNGKKYVGQTTNDPSVRWGKNGSCYTRKKSCVGNAIKKYGWNKIKHDIIFEFTAKNKKSLIEVLNIVESKEIIDNNSLYPNGYNLTLDCTNSFVSEATRKKMSKNMRALQKTAYFKEANRQGKLRMYQNPEEYKKRVKNMKKYLQTSEVKKKRAISKKKYFESGGKVWNAGKNYNEEDMKSYKKALDYARHVRWHINRGIKKDGCEFCKKHCTKK